MEDDWGFGFISPSTTRRELAADPEGQARLAVGLEMLGAELIIDGGMATL
jgi:hypothetical protein